MTTKTTFRVGDVVSYTPDDRWCHEGTAVARDVAGRVVLFDTYWGLNQTQLTEAEAATAEVLFNLGDWQEWDDRREGAPGACWSDFHPDDRQVITSQHGLQRTLFVRPGAVPDHGTKVAKARAEIARLEEKIRSEQRALEWARHDLNALLSEARPMDGNTPEQGHEDGITTAALTLAAHARHDRVLHERIWEGTSLGLPKWPHPLSRRLWKVMNALSDQEREAFLTSVARSVAGWLEFRGRALDNLQGHQIDPCCSRDDR